MSQKSHVFENAGSAALATREAGRSRFISPSSRFVRTRSLGMLLSLLSLPAFAQPTPPGSPKTSGDVVVLDRVEIAEKSDDQTPLNAVGALDALVKTPGAVSVVDSSLVSRGRVGTSADILAFQPGVFAAPPAGNGDGIKISARGSGIARSAGNFFRNGILFTFDGLPVTGPGGTPYELFETYGVNYTEVLLGGNAFDYGALQLGGAINYVTKTGYDAPRFEARADVGSFGYRKYQVSSGQVIDKADAFISVTSSQADGYQENAKSSSEGFAGNFGYRFSPNLSTRVFLRYRQTENENPGNITLNQLRGDSSKANPDNVVGRVNRIQPGSTWIGNRTDIVITPDSKLELGFVHHNAPIDIQPNPSPGTASNANADRERSIWNFRDVTASAKYTRQDTLSGHESDTTVALVVSEEYDADVNTYAQNPNVTTGARKYGNLLKTANYNGSNDSSVRLSNQFGLTDKLWVNTGASGVYIRRASEVTYFNPALTPATPPPGSGGASLDRDNLYFAPRFGVRYDVNPAASLFANVTRSIEGPNSWQLNRGSAGNVNFHDDIRDQKAIAYEIGGRARAGAFTGSVGVYYSAVKDELLSVPINPLNPALGNYTFNGPDTYKQGVEIGLQTLLWSGRGFFEQPLNGPATKVTFTQTLTANDFGYRRSSVFGTADELPGVPRQSYQARLAFEHAAGFYANASLFYASSYYADFANSLETPSYALLDLGVGYEHPRTGWKVFLDARNVTDRQYASSAGPAFNAAGSANSAQFQAGDGFGLYGGVTVRF